MVSIVSTWPAVPSWNHMFMLEAMTFKLTVAIDDKTVLPSQLCAQVWTNLYHRGNPDGAWRAIDLNCNQETIKTESDGRTVCEFSESIILTSDGEAYRFTFRVRINSQSDCSKNNWIWASGYMMDGIVKISPPTGEKWTKGPEFNHILEGVHLGNFMASSIADELGFDSVLNVADNLDLVPSKFSRHINYKKVPMRDGARNQIPDELIREAVAWLTEENNAKRKIIVNCRAGIGRAGSTVVAFVFSQHPAWSFEQAYEYVFSKRFVYPHHRLKETLYKLYPRHGWWGTYDKWFDLLGR